jgi:hypothetical protein
MSIHDSVFILIVYKQFSYLEENPVPYFPPIVRARHCQARLEVHLMVLMERQAHHSLRQLLSIVCAELDIFNALFDDICQMMSRRDNGVCCSRLRIILRAPTD